MKAMVYHRYGPPEVLHLAGVPKPAPKANEVLIRIHATTVTTADWRARSLTLPPGFGVMGRLVFGIFGPRKPILGTELAGVVEEVGSAVTRFAAGDEVFAFTGAHYGCHAEYHTLAEDGLIAIKPPRLLFEEAAALSFGGTAGLIFLRDKGGIRRRDRVLIVGASVKVEYMTYLAAIAATGELKPVIDRRYPLARTAEAHAYVDTGRKRGNVVLTIRDAA